MAIEKARRLSNFSSVHDLQIQEMLDKFNAMVDEFYDAIYPVGYIMEWPWNDLPERGTWAWMDDRTIGDASSNATAVASSGTYSLFAKIWADYNNTTAPIYNSDGSASTRGSDVATDWVAHKQISIPKRQGRSVLAMDDYHEGGTAANITTAIFADTLGAVGGEEKHTMTTSELVQHRHGTGLANTGTKGTGSYIRLDYTDWKSPDTPTLLSAYTGNSSAFNVTHSVVTTKYIIRY